MTEEEVDKYLKENAKIAYEYLSSQKNTLFDDKYGYKEFEKDFCCALANNVRQQIRKPHIRHYFLRYFGGIFIYEKHFEDSVWGKIREGAIKFTPLPK